jgi:hypothetical protein
MSRKKFMKIINHAPAYFLSGAVHAQRKQAAAFQMLH